MSKLLKCKIDVLKIDKTRLFKGAKGTYLDIDIWILEKPDQFGSDVSIQQQTKKDEPKIYIGNGKIKEFENKQPVAKDEYQKSGKVQTGSMSNIEDLPGAVDDNPDNLPF
jgi:hypothetical protein